MEDLIQKSMNQNYVPVVDDQKKFIGIVTRKSIIEYCYEKLKKMRITIDFGKYAMLYYNSMPHNEVSSSVYQTP